MNLLNTQTNIANKCFSYLQHTALNGLVGLVLL